MPTKFDSLQAQYTWVLVPLLTIQNILECKWLFKMKFNSNGYISIHKAHLIHQWNKQEFGIYYMDTFNLIAKIITIHLFHTIITTHN